MTCYLVFRRASPVADAVNPRGDGILWEHVAGGLKGHAGYVDVADPWQAVLYALRTRGEELKAGDEFEVYPVQGSAAFGVDLNVRVLREDPKREAD